MANYTDFLSLYEVDTENDGNDTFNIDTMLNNNWDKIDTAIADLDDEKIAKLAEEISDFNNAQRAGIYKGADASNAPVSNSAITVFAFRYDTNSCFQIAYKNEDKNAMWFRQYDDIGGWGDWHRPLLQDGSVSMVGNLNLGGNLIKNVNDIDHSSAKPFNFINYAEGQLTGLYLTPTGGDLTKFFDINPDTLQANFQNGVIPYANGNRILTTADEGTGNGLDADTIDGLHESDLVLVDGTNDINTGLTIDGGTDQGYLKIIRDNGSGTINGLKLAIGRSSENPLIVREVDGVVQNKIQLGSSDLYYDDNLIYSERNLDSVDVPYSSGANLNSTDVKNALDELDNEKLNNTGDTIDQLKIGNPYSNTESGELNIEGKTRIGSTADYIFIDGDTGTLNRADGGDITVTNNLTVNSSKLSIDNGTVFSRVELNRELDGANWDYILGAGRGGTDTALLPLVLSKNGSQVNKLVIDSLDGEIQAGLDEHTMWHNGNVTYDEASGNDQQGSIEFPNGFIMKWGYVTDVATHTHRNITFDTAFPSAMIIAQCDGSHQTGSIVTVDMEDANSDRFGLVVLNTHEDQVQDGFWIAIGY